MMHSFNIFKIISNQMMSRLLLQHICSTQPIPIVFTSAMVCENKSHFGPELNEIALDVIDLKARKKKMLEAWH